METNLPQNEEHQVAIEQDAQLNKPASSVYLLYTHPWFQITLIGVICFCCPGMYNALSGIGGSGQVNSTIAANATVALLSATAVTALFFVGPIFDIIGPRWCLIIGGWTYALYSGSLLNYNRTQNGAFVIASGAILGIGASFLWVAQGAIMTSYIPESQKGRAIAVFWIIFNLGGGVGSFVSFGLNYDSKSGTVTDSTYIALMVIMLFGWALGCLICLPSQVRMKEITEVEKKKGGILGIGKTALETMLDWRIWCMLPMFFCANVFYSYQQNIVNGETFDLRTRSLNGALYWLAQMFGGLAIGTVLDMRVPRPLRAKIGWVVLFVVGFVIWGGGYAFQKWENRRLANGLKQDIDFTDGKISTGPIFLYIFYGAYDALWQGYCYWIIGATSNSAAIVAVLVGSYKTFQAVGGAMAWRINALAKPAMTQLGMDWGLCMASLVIALPMVWTVTNTSVVNEEVVVEADGKVANEEVKPVS